jgi:PAS domain S-box-containing protein
VAEAVVARESVTTRRDEGRIRPSLRTVQVALLVGIAYYVGAEIGLALTLQPHPVSTLWPPNAMLLAGLLLTPVRWWWLVLLAAFPAHVAVELKGGIPLPMTLCWFVSNSSEALIGAAAIRWLSKGEPRLDSFQGVAIFVFGALIATFLSSFLDAWFVALNGFGQAGFWDTWRTRSFSNILATLTLVPVIVTLGTGGLAELRRAPARRLVEAALLAISLLFVCAAVFTSLLGGPRIAPPLLYAPLPILLWAAVRFGPGTTSACLLTVALLAIWGAIRGEGPFIAGSAAEKALTMQLFLIMIAIPLMALAAVTQDRARAESEARTSEDRLTLAMSAAQMGTWEWEIHADRGSWSGKSREIFGLEAEPGNLSLANFLALVHPEDRPAVTAAVSHAIESGGPYEAEFRVQHPDGSVRWVLSKGKPTYDEAGRSARLLGVNADITKRKLAEAAASEWKSRYVAAIQSSNQLLYDWDPETNEVSYGGDLARILGYSSEEMGCSLVRFIDLVHPADRQAFEREIERVRATGESFQCTYRVRRKDGRIIWVEDRGHFIRGDSGRITRMVGFLEDITERTRHYQALRSSEERFSKAFRTSPDAIVITRRSDGRIIEVNDTWEHLFSYDREEVLGRSAADLGMYVAPSDRARLTRMLSVSGRVREHELELRTKTGEVLETVLSADTVDMGGEPCFITFIRDLTGRRRAEREAQEQRVELAHLSRVAMLGELSGALAHELNQPLTAILANVRAAQRLLGADAPDLPEVGSILEDIAQDDRRAGEVIHRLRAFLRKGDMQPRPLDLNEVVTEALDLVHSDTIHRMVTLDPQLTQALPTVSADRVQIQQVLLNLILNAFEAMSGNPRDQRRLTIATSASATEVCLSLADQGSGIPPDKLEWIFEPFATTKEHGLGLGLAICRSIVMAHGGRLWAENNGDGGATFHLELHRNLR